MSHAFVREYNQAYDKLLTSFFREHGIPFDETTSFEEAWKIAEDLKARGTRMIPADRTRRNAFEFRKHLAPHELIFWDYCNNWVPHKESRPSYFRFVRQIMSLSGESDSGYETMRKIEMQVHQDGSFLRSDEQVSLDFFAFYKKYVLIPLAKDLDDGVDTRKLVVYFTSDDLKGLPDSATSGVEEVEKEVYRRAATLLTDLRTISPTLLKLEIQTSLKAHDSDPKHMREFVGTFEGVETRTWTCEHMAGQVLLKGFQASGRVSTQLWVSPSRGFNSSDYVIGEGWNSVVFPDYEVLKPHGIFA